MNGNAPRQPNINGLRAMTVGEFCHSGGGKLAQAIISKTNTLDRRSLGDEILEQNVRLLSEIVCRGLRGEYPNLSLLAFVHFLGALHYFLWRDDRNPDTQIRGFEDDRAEVLHVVQLYKDDIEAYKRWRERTRQGTAGSL